MGQTTASPVRRGGFFSGLQIRYAPIAGVALVAAGAALWGTDAAFRKPLVDSWSPWTIVLYEHVILVAIVAWFVIRNRRRLRGLERSTWLSLVWIAWGGSALATLAFTTAFEYGNPDTIVLLQKTQPLWAIAAAAVVVREVPRPQIVYVLLPAALGTYLLSFGWGTPPGGFTGDASKAAFLALLAAALWGSATAFGRRALRQLDSGMVTSMRFVLALPFLLFLVLVRGGGELSPGSAQTAGDWTRLVLLAVFPGLVALLLYYRGLRVTPAPVATFAELAFPATALLVNYFYLGATLSLSQVLGLVILIVTIALLHFVPVRIPVRPAASPARQAASATG